jgi:hypothetical protein
MKRLPVLLAHADWSTNPLRRRLAIAVLGSDGRYTVHKPVPAGDPMTLLERLRAIALHGAILLGVDFPIGLPVAYAERAEIVDFASILPMLGSGRWKDFYRVAEHPTEIRIERPFYPHRAGAARQWHLYTGLGMNSIDALRRRCDLATSYRPAAAPIFWTLGAQQVGKATIVGWRDMLGPARRTSWQENPAYPWLWPFDGYLAELIESERLVVAETYPRECLIQLGIRLEGSKRKRHHRMRAAEQLLHWALDAEVRLDPQLYEALSDGFGDTGWSEDAFDATVGLFGLLNIVLGRHVVGEPEDQRIRQIEGWMLGLVV